MQKITPFLWFDGKAEEAMEFYLSVFKDARQVSVMRYGDSGPGPKGAVMAATFELEGQRFIALNGGPQFTFSPAISFFVTCQTQDEVDHYWEKLSAHGEPLQCGWLKDRYGVTWQIVPACLNEMMHDPDPARSGRVMQALRTMIKLDIAALKSAYEK